jgi:hypothetical protein
MLISRYSEIRLLSNFYGKVIGTLVTPLCLRNIIIHNVMNVGCRVSTNSATRKGVADHINKVALLLATQCTKGVELLVSSTGWGTYIIYPMTQCSVELCTNLYKVALNDVLVQHTQSLEACNLLKNRLLKQKHIALREASNSLFALITDSKVKQSLYTPWRRLGGEEV